MPDGITADGITAFAAVISALVVCAQCLVSIVLVGVTVVYVKVTGDIARASAASAAAADRSAEAAREHLLLSARPQLVIAGALDLAPTGGGRERQPHRPSKFSLTIENSGVGPALDAIVDVTVGGVRYEVPPIVKNPIVHWFRPGGTIRPGAGEGVLIVAALPTALDVPVEGDFIDGVLGVTYEDIFSQRWRIEWELTLPTHRTGVSDIPQLGRRTVISLDIPRDPET